MLAGLVISSWQDRIALRIGIKTLIFRNHKQYNGKVFILPGKVFGNAGGWHCAGNII
jgi:hypothetical protein